MKGKSRSSAFGRSFLCVVALGLTSTGCGLNLFFSPFPMPVDTFDVSTARPGPRNISIRTIQPALAVRGMSCLICHAHVKSNIITDFGFGDPWYLGGSNANIESLGWYNNYANTWQSAEKISGQIFLPNQQIPESLKKLGNTSVSTPKTLWEIFTTDYDTEDEAHTGPYLSRTTNNANKSMAASVQPPSGLPPVVAKQQIVIRAPTASEILNLVPAFTQDPTKVAFAEFRGLFSTTPRTNFLIAGTDDNLFVTNPTDSDVLYCYGDIVINGTLFLKEAHIATDHDGCRLYVTGTVFIEGAITYTPDSIGPNLQISSSRAIMMGIGSRVIPQFGFSDTLSPMEYRLLHDARNPDVRAYSPELGGPGWPVLAHEILADAEKVIATNGPLLDSAESASRYVDFNGLLLNAPVVQSRYLGVFKGTIVSELALFALGAFHFEFDPVFVNVPTFPLLPSDILLVN